MGSKQLLVFDFDGVIADSMAVFIQIFGEVFEKFDLKFPLSTEEAFRAGYESAWEKNFTENGMKVEQLPKVIEYFESVLSYDSVSPFPNILGILKDLSSDYSLAILSTTRNHFIEGFLNKYTALNYFKKISGGEGNSAKAERLEKLLVSLNFSKSTAIMIGDTASDIQAGKKVGIPTIGVTYGWYSPERIVAENPTRHVDSPSLLPETIKQIFLNNLCD